VYIRKTRMKKERNNMEICTVRISDLEIVFIRTYPEIVLPCKSVPVLKLSETDEIFSLLVIPL
jgi:hypothetical protein